LAAEPPQDGALLIVPEPAVPVDLLAPQPEAVEAL
jgi:hypothetical protein